MPGTFLDGKYVDYASLPPLTDAQKAEWAAAGYDPTDAHITLAQARQNARPLDRNGNVIPVALITPPPYSPYGNDVANRDPQGPVAPEMATSAYANNKDAYNSFVKSIQEYNAPIVNGTLTGGGAGGDIVPLPIPSFVDWWNKFVKVPLTVDGATPPAQSAPFVTSSALKPYPFEGSSKPTMDIGPSTFVAGDFARANDASVGAPPQKMLAPVATIAPGAAAAVSNNHFMVWLLVAVAALFLLRR